MKIPNKIIIGNSNYNVFEVKKLSRSIWDLIKSKTYVGRIRHNKYIKIKKYEKDKDKKIIFFHEIAHGICYELEDKYYEFKKLNYNENFIDSFGEILMKTFNIKRPIQKKLKGGLKKI